MKHASVDNQPQNISHSRRIILGSSLNFIISPGESLASLSDSIRQLSDQKPPTIYIGLVDVSLSNNASISIKETSKVALKNFYNRSNPGDELIIGSIGDARMDKIRMQKRSLFKTGKIFQDKTILGNAIRDELAWADEELSKPKAPQSRYIETLAAHQPSVMRALQLGANVKVLIIGDGVECSEECDFENTTKFNNQTIPRILDQLENRRMLLRDPRISPPADPARVELIFIGAGGSTSANWQLTRHFWESYSKKSLINLLFYGPEIPPFM